MAHERLIWNLNIIRNFNLMFWFTSEINSFDRRDYFSRGTKCGTKWRWKQNGKNKRKFMMSFMLRMGTISIVLARRRERERGRKYRRSSSKKIISKNCHTFTDRHPTTGKVRGVLSHSTWSTILFAFGELFWPCADWSCVLVYGLFFSLLSSFFICVWLNNNSWQCKNRKW